MAGLYKKEYLGRSAQFLGWRVQNRVQEIHVIGYPITLGAERYWEKLSAICPMFQT